MIIGIVDGSLIKNKKSATSCIITSFNAQAYNEIKVDILLEEYTNYIAQAYSIKGKTAQAYKKKRKFVVEQKLNNIYKILESLEIELFIKDHNNINNSTDIEKQAILDGIEIIEKNRASLYKDNKEYIIYSDCANSFDSKFNEIIKNVKWIKGHISNPVQECADLGAKLGALTGRAFYFKGKIKNIINTLLKELNKENEKLGTRELKKREDKDLKNKKVLTLKEENKRGLFEIYYEQKLVYQLYANNIKDVFDFCVGNNKKVDKVDVEVIKITEYFKKNPRTLREGDAIKDCREAKCWISFKIDPVTDIVTPRYSFKIEEFEEEEKEEKDQDKNSKIKLCHIKNKPFCIYALKSLEKRNIITISSYIILRTDQLKENQIPQVICVGSLLECINSALERKEYIQLRKEIKNKQKQLKNLQGLIKKLNKQDINKAQSIFHKIYGSTKNELDINFFIKKEIKRIIYERNYSLAESIYNLKTNSRFFL